MKEAKEKFGIDVTVLISKQGEFVLNWYKLLKEIQDTFDKVMVEKTANIPFIHGPLQVGKYKFLFVSPLTGNSTAKVAYGIADSMITNAIAQTMKGGVPVYIYPVDQREGELVTTLPNGKKLTLYSRKVDLDNVEKIRMMKGITVLSHPSEITEIIKNIQK